MSAVAVIPKNSIQDIDQLIIEDVTPALTIVSIEHIALPFIGVFQPLDIPLKSTGCKPQYTICMPQEYSEKEALFGKIDRFYRDKISPLIKSTVQTQFQVWFEKTPRKYLINWRNKFKSQLEAQLLPCFSIEYQLAILKNDRVGFRSFFQQNEIPVDADTVYDAISPTMKKDLQEGLLFASVYGYDTETDEKQNI